MFSELQEKFEAELEKHKSQVNQTFEDFSARLEGKDELDEVFKETVVEHLRLSRDEGAKITATAFAEAEKLAEEKAEVEAASIGITEILAAVNDISTKDSQSAILKSLVSHAEQFTPRGAFFIIKKEHLVGWRVFGKENSADNKTIREVFFPVGSSTILGESVKSLSAVKGSFGNHADDSIYLNKLDFGQPENMFAIPLVVRGRAVAVLYADNGSEEGRVNIEALETLVRVASLTVEVLAGGAQTAQRYEVEDENDGVQEDQTEDSNEYESGEQAESNAQYEVSRSEVDNSASNAQIPQSAANFGSGDYQTETFQTGQETSSAESYSNDYINESAVQDSSADEYSFEVQPQKESSFQPEEIESNQYAPEPENYSWNQPSETSADSENFSSQPQEVSQDYEFESDSQPIGQTDSQTYEIEDAGSIDDYAQTSQENFQTEQPQPEPETYQFETGQENLSSDFDYQENQQQSAQFETSKLDSNQFGLNDTAQLDSNQFQSPQVDDFSSTPADVSQQFESINQGFENQPTPPPPPQVEQTAPSPPVRSRFSDRNVDLPIEVSEEERRLHNDARRFARLLVSEIKLYNEQKVKEGREGKDLYERLREAIDRSREMYDKRVQSPVAARFDYFHYEVINTLAEGEEEKLGEGYPGAAV